MACLTDVLHYVSQSWSLTTLKYFHEIWSLLIISVSMEFATDIVLCRKFEWIRRHYRLWTIYFTEIIRLFASLHNHYYHYLLLMATLYRCKKSFCFCKPLQFLKQSVVYNLHRQIFPIITISSTFSWSNRRPDSFASVSNQILIRSFSNAD